MDVVVRCASRMVENEEGAELLLCCCFTCSTWVEILPSVGHTFFCLIRIFSTWLLSLV